MEAFLGRPLVRRIAASIGVVGAVALAFYYVLLPALTVPVPAMYGFYVAWAVLVVLSVAWWRSNPWRSLLVPVVGLVGVLAVLYIGEQLWHWGP